MAKVSLILSRQLQISLVASLMRSVDSVSSLVELLPCDFMVSSIWSRQEQMHLMEWLSFWVVEDTSLVAVKELVMLEAPATDAQDLLPKGELEYWHSGFLASSLIDGHVSWE